MNAVVVQPDGRILIAGLFNHFDGQARKNIARLEANGDLDTTLSPGTAASGDPGGLFLAGIPVK